MDSKKPYRWHVPYLNDPKLVDEKHRLRILNSFTRKKELFVPNQNKTISWYSCGPTVYDVSHLGHARCYITFDIIRRILANYFGFNIFYVMNITDVDDKIIKRARSNYLCDKFIENFLNHQNEARSSLLKEIKVAIENYQLRRADEIDPAKLEMITNISTMSNHAINDLDKFISSNCDDKQKLGENLEKLRDVIADYQDEKLAHTVSDHKIFKALTMKFEQEYHEDMQRLDVMPPSALTRVSEYIDEIGIYIKKIEANGFAYRSNGSVYFDTQKFEADPKHTYAKLVREAYGQKKSLDEGEGELTTALQDTKKSPNDFALWKKSKSGEPSWQTQDYDNGRPGWHIECSVMACNLLGENFDIHSGGCDLKFPHHDNEIAQAEAYYNTGNNWVNFFIHSGHLSISGCKMSKSLKNFITIRQALQEYTSRQLRFAFLAHSWAETLDYSPNTMSTAISYERAFKEFFLNVTDIVRKCVGKLSMVDGSRSCLIFHKWTNDDKQLNQDFMDATLKVDAALCDNFDTRLVLNILSALVKGCNKRTEIDLILLKDITNYIARILMIMGASFDEVNLDRFFGKDLQNKTDAGDTNQTQSETIFKYVDTLAQFRAEVRRISKAGETKETINKILALCDNLRDETLPNLGVRLEDKDVDGQSYVVKLVDAETIRREREIALKRDQEEQVRKQTAELEKLKLQQKREEKSKIPPQEMFKLQSDKYSQFDDKGLPTHDSSGKEVSKSALKKLQRLYAEQEARYSKHMSEQPK